MATLLMGTIRKSCGEVLSDGEKEKPQSGEGKGLVGACVFALYFFCDNLSIYNGGCSG